MLAKRGRYPSTVENAFREWFPLLWRFVKKINAKDHGTLIRFLQRLESWLVVEMIAPVLVDRVPIVTLHDAIFCGCGDLPVLEAAFEEVFAKIGFTPAVKQEHWT